MKSPVIIGGIAFGVVICGLWVVGSFVRLGQRVDALEVLQVGRPFAEFESLGFKSYRQEEVKYLGRKATVYEFGSSKGYGSRAETSDYALLVNSEGIIECIFSLSSDADRERFKDFIQSR